MKKLVVIILCVIMVTSLCFVFVGCDNADYKIGIGKFIGNEALNRAADGFKDEMDKLMAGIGKTVSYKEKDAAGDLAMPSQISKSLIGGIDLFYAIATPMMMAAATEAKEYNLPVVGTAVTRYDQAILDYGNVTGTSDMNPLEKQFELMKLLDTSNTKKFGILYTTSEVNSGIQKDMLKALCQADGITLVEAGVSDKNDLIVNMNKLEECGVIFCPTDNIIANAAPQVHSNNVENAQLRKPIVWGEIGPHKTSGVATYGIDYYELGKISAEMAFDILVNGKKPADMPIREAQNYEFALNEKVANEIGYTIPDSVKALKTA